MPRGTIVAFLICNYSYDIVSGLDLLSQVACVLQNMLSNLSNNNVQQVAHKVIDNGFFDDSDFEELAHQVRVNKIPPPVAHKPFAADALLLLGLQIVAKGMETSNDVINCTNLAVSLIIVNSEPAVKFTAVSQPLGGDSGPGKAFRQVSSCRFTGP